MRVSIRIGPILVACASILASAQEQEWTEQMVLSRFLDQNPINRETKARLAAVEAETRGRTLYANPSVNFSREGAGRTEFYQTSQTVHWSGRFSYIRQAGSAQSESVTAEGAFSLWQARTSLRNAFYRALAGQQRIRVWQDSSNELARVIRILEQREREGEGSKLDRLRAEREQLDLTTSANLVRADQQHEAGEILRFLPSASPTPTALSGTLDTSSSIPPVDQLLVRALEARPDLQAERKRIEQMKKEQQAADRLKFTEPVVSAGLKRADIGLPRIVTGAVAGVSWDLPLFNRGKTEVAKFAAEETRITARLDILHRQIRAAVESSWRVLQVRLAARDLFASSQSVADDEIVRIATVAYQEGEIGILQLLDALRLRREGQLKRIDLSLAAKEAQIELEAQTGEEFPK